MVTEMRLMGGRWRACKGAGGSCPDMPCSFFPALATWQASDCVAPLQPASHQPAGYVAEAEQGLELPPAIMHNLQKVPPASLLHLPPLPAIQLGSPDGRPPLPPLLLLHSTSA